MKLKKKKNFGTTDYYYEDRNDKIIIWYWDYSPNQLYYVSNINIDSWQEKIYLCRTSERIEYYIR